MKKIVIANHKGGVGKTTSSINISAGLAKKGKNVIIIDADPQSNLTESFGIFDPVKDLYLSFSKGEPLPIINVKKNLSIVPNSLNFSGIESVFLKTGLDFDLPLSGIFKSGPTSK